MLNFLNLKSLLSNSFFLVASSLSILCSIGKRLGSSSDKKSSTSTVFAAVYPDSEETIPIFSHEETTSDEVNGLMVNDYQILYSRHHNPHQNLSQI